MLFLFLPLVFATPLCSLYIFLLNYVSNLSGIPQLMFQLDLFYQFQNQILTCYLGISTCLSHRHLQLKTSKQNLSFLSRKGYSSPPSLLFLLVPYSTQSLKFENCGSCLTFVISVQSVIHLSFFLKISLSSPLLVTSIFFFNNFIYLWLYWVSSLYRVFSSCSERVLLLVGQVSHCGGFSFCTAQALGRVGFSS